jgi:hypothetical protein
MESRARSLRRTVSVCTLVAALGIAAPDAFAQGGGARTESSVFGPNRSSTSGRDRLNLTFTATEAVDSEIPDELAPQLARGPLVASGGLSTLLVGSGSYAYNRRRYRFAANGSSTYRYYSRVNRFDATSHTGGVGLNVQVPGMFNLQADQRFAYAPSYLYQLFPSTTTPELGESIDPGVDYEVVHRDSYMLQSDVKLSRSLARGTLLSASGSYDRTSFGEVPEDQNRRPRLESYQLGTALSQSLRRNMQLQVNYEYRKSEFQFGFTREHRVSMGVGYSRAISRSRRWSVVGYLAPSTITIPESTADDLPPGRAFRLQGGVSVQYPFRHNWSLSANVQRGVDYIAVLGEPVLSNGASLSIKGLLTQRIDFMATASLVDSESPLQQFTRLDSRTARARLRYAFSRHVAFFSEYIYYAYDLSGRELLREELPPIVDQHGFRMGVTLWTSPF